MSKKASTKLLWSRRHNAYRANADGRWYEVKKVPSHAGLKLWSAYTWTAEYMADGLYLHKELPTLAKAKQACVAHKASL